MSSHPASGFFLMLKIDQQVASTLAAYICTIGRESTREENVELFLDIKMKACTVVGGWGGEVPAIYDISCMTPNLSYEREEAGDIRGAKKCRRWDKKEETGNTSYSLFVSYSIGMFTCLFICFMYMEHICIEV